MKITKRRAGITLLELVVSIAILSMASAALFAILLGSLRGWSVGTSKESANSHATIALQKLGNDVREARSAQVSEDGGTLEVTFPALIEDPTTHQQIYDLSANDPTPRYYYVTDNNLFRSVGGQAVIFGRGISSVQFGAAGGAVTIDLQSTEQVGTVTSSQSVTGRVYLRNYRS